MLLETHALSGCSRYCSGRERGEKRSREKFVRSGPDEMKVMVNGASISPLYWALRDGKYALVDFILRSVTP